MASDTDKRPQEQKREGRLARHRRIAGEIYAQPRTLGGHLRDGLLSVWVARGAGFYGLGWIITFLVLEVTMFSNELAESAGVTEFIGSQLIEYVFRMGFLSLVNSLLAAIWPVYLLQWLSGYGILVFVGGYFAFEKLLRPVVEGRFPELRAAREAKAARQREKEARKRVKKKPSG
ncbi:MAG: hypothetical protein R3E82_18675 [Pseudomonadales bacterium]|nr:hypothetical protein [Pseudomonadales bacterium]